MNQRSKKIVIEGRLFIVPSRKLNHSLKISSYFDPKLIYKRYTERAIFGFVLVSRFVDIRRRKKERRGNRDRSNYRLSGKEASRNVVINGDDVSEKGDVRFPVRYPRVRSKRTSTKRLN